MESNNNRIIDMSFIVTGILLWLVTTILVQTVGAMAGGVVGRSLNTTFALHILPVIVGVGVIAALRFNKATVTWADEVIGELRKIVWPSRKDTVAMTIVVCIMLLIAGLVIGGFDIGSSYAIDFLLNL